MPVVGNRFYNDPAIGAAMQNIAGMFAPPSAQDSFAYAKAASEKNDAARKMRAYDTIVDPAATRDMIDRQLLGTGQATPIQSFYAVDQGNLTTQRGQDIGSADSRYSTDVGARTLMSNNAADNSRMLQTNSADNTRQTITSLYGALNPGQIAPAVPAEIAGMVGLPGVDERLGAPKPMSMDEMRAITFGQLPQGARDREVMGDVPVEQIIDPETNQPKIVYRPDAVGQQPFLKPGAEGKATNALAVLPDKTRVPAVQGPDGKWTNAQTGEVLPAGIEIYDTPKPQGSAADVGLPGNPTEFTQRNAMFYNRAAIADDILKKGLTAGYQPSARDFELMLGGPGDTLPLSLSNQLVSNEGRQFYNSAMGFMMSVLRPDTGAAFGKDEFQNYARVFIPLPGDDPQTLANKENARATALSALKGTSKGGADEITRLMIANGVDVPDEMLRMMTPGAGPTPTAAPPAPGAPASRMRFDENGNPI